MNTYYFILIFHFCDYMSNFSSISTNFFPLGFQIVFPFDQCVDVFNQKSKNRVLNKLLWFSFTFAFLFFPNMSFRQLLCRNPCGISCNFFLIFKISHFPLIKLLLFLAQSSYNIKTVFSQSFLFELFDPNFKFIHFIVLI